MYYIGKATVLLYDNFNKTDIYQHIIYLALPSLWLIRQWPITKKNDGI